MEVTYLGGSAFQVKGERVVVINPESKANKGDIVLRSRRSTSRSEIVNGPGEYEIGGVLIIAMAVGPRESEALAHAAEVDGINILFVDRHVAPLTEIASTAVGTVDVLIVRADDLRAAQELAQDVTPRVVIPFGEKAADLCAALGVKDAAQSARFAWNGVSAAPKAVLLKGPAARKKATRAA